MPNGLMSNTLFNSQARQFDSIYMTGQNIGRQAATQYGQLNVQQTSFPRIK
jgi:hypothetical protein